MVEDVRYILFINANDTSRHTSSANTSIYPNLGLLTLMSSLRPRLEGTDLRVGYLDGTVHGNPALEEFIDAHAHRIQALCFSVLTANYGASVAMAQRAKRINPQALVVFGNDHFSALYDRVMANQPWVDVGFYGNDVVEGFTDFMADRFTGVLRPTMDYAGLVYRDASGTVHRNPENPAEYGRLPLVATPAQQHSGWGFGWYVAAFSGSLLAFILTLWAGSSPTGRRHIERGMWLIILLLALLPTSYYGQYGPHTAISFPTDIAVVAALSLLTYRWAVSSGYHTEDLEQILQSENDPRDADSADQQPP
jgi:hypothetical protein